MFFPSKMKIPIVLLALKDYLQRATKGKQPKLPYSCHFLASAEPRIKELSKLQCCTWKGKKSLRRLLSVYPADQMAKSPPEPGRGATPAFLRSPSGVKQHQVRHQKLQMRVERKVWGFSKHLSNKLSSVFASPSSDFLTVVCSAKVAFSSQRFG